MSTPRDPATIFPSWHETPRGERLATSMKQTEYLLGGEIRRWEGPAQDVLSPICLCTDGELRRHRIGSYPIQTGREVLQALEAAVRAHDHGREAWPSLSVQDRISHEEQFGPVIPVDRAGPNTFPFTGRKDAAEGTLSVSDALRIFTIRTPVAAKGGELIKHILWTIARERSSSLLSTDFTLQSGVPTAGGAFLPA